MDELKELHEAICELNEEVYNKTNHDEIYFSLETNTYSTLVKFMDTVVWNSEADDRDYDDDKDCYSETYAQCIRRETNRMLDIIRKLKF